jgi:hypothetical protein
MPDNRLSRRRITVTTLIALFLVGHGAVGEQARS